METDQIKYIVIMNKTACFILILLSTLTCISQEHIFTKQDTLRGTITPERSWWDLNHYHLDITVDPDKKLIKGKNTIQYIVLEPYQTLQIDLQPPMTIEKVLQDGKELTIASDGNAHFIKLRTPQIKGDNKTIEVYYGGHPRPAVNAPWDGGISWKKDTEGNHFIASSCQGLGASVWWPNKDHMYDEVDSMKISVTVPKGLMNVSNGRLVKTETHPDQSHTYHWEVTNPINNYGVNINIGNYVHFGEKYNGEKGILDMDYYVLKNNLDLAKKQFKDAPKMMKAFEHWFGPYPFYEDSFKLVEAPYLGMEHQSSVTYGNGFANGYRGKDLSGTGWGLKFDFIIIHEAGHEWFANSITNKDIADMWIHESFTAYSECLFVEYYYGKKAGAEYVIGTRKNIRNDKPIIGMYDVNHEGSGDMYYKGSNMLHTLRQLVEDDKLWRKLLRGLNKDFYHQTVTTQQIESYISKVTKKDLSAFFDQYLRDPRIPTLEYQLDNNGIKYRYVDIVKGFDMPIILQIDNKPTWVFPTSEWKELNVKTKNVALDSNFLIKARIL